MINSGRLQRAVWLEVQPIDGGYLVRRGADDHIVDIDGGYVRCDCIDQQRNGDGCKHALCVRLLHGDREVVLALRHLVARPAQRGPAPKKTLCGNSTA